MNNISRPDAGEVEFSVFDVKYQYQYLQPANIKLK